MAKPNPPSKARIGKTTNKLKAKSHPESTTDAQRTFLLVLAIISVTAIVFVFNFMTGGLHSFLFDQHKFVGENAAPVVSGRNQAQSLIQQYVHDVSAAGIPFSGQPLSVGEDTCEKESHSFMSNPNLSDFSFSCRIGLDIYIATSYDKCGVSSALLATNKYRSNKESCEQDGSLDSFTLLNQKRSSAEKGPTLLDNNGIRVDVRQTSDFKRGAAVDLSSDTNGAFVTCQSSPYLTACKQIGSREEFQKFAASLPADTQSIIDVNARSLFYYIQH